jgi:Flp pilus assembly protein TadG
VWTINMKAVSKLSAPFGHWRAFAADQSGNMLMLFAFSAPIALGFAALGTEGGELYWKKAAIQAAADQAAVSASQLVQLIGDRLHNRGQSGRCVDGVRRWSEQRDGHRK